MLQIPRNASPDCIMPTFEGLLCIIIGIILKSIDVKVIRMPKAAKGANDITVPPLRYKNDFNFQNRNLNPIVKMVK